MKFVALALALLPLASQAAVQKDTTPFKQLRSQLELRAGQTYLSFMVNQVKPALDSYKDEIADEAEKNPKQFKKWQADLIEAGAGVAIRIDDKNYFFNVGYGSGSNGADDLKSGRSYGVGPTHRQSDPSDIAYLTELEQYLKGEPQNAQKFYQAILEVILNCDTSGWSELSQNGQIVATDFLAIYTAELDRHLMIDLKPGSHPWEIDLAAATFDAAYVAASGKMVKDGELTKGSVKEFWAPGKQGSGIGETRSDRKALQKILAKFEAKAKNGSRTIETLKGLLDSESDDVIQSMLEYVNAPSQADKKKFDAKFVSKVESSMLEYLAAISGDADEISAQ
ncbi:MAG: hypothetical protein ACXVCK_04190 [Bdellovibrionota bacterium]